MNTWIEPIYSRTQEDVQEAKQLTQKILIEGWDSLTTEEQSFYLGDMIGTLNPITLNRIENNTEYIEQYFESLGFREWSDSYKKNWNYLDLPIGSDFERILRNITHVVDARYLTESSVPGNLNAPTFDQINTIEKLLQELKDMYETIPKSYKYSGTFNSGQVIVLPQRS